MKCQRCGKIIELGYCVFVGRDGSDQLVCCRDCADTVTTPSGGVIVWLAAAVAFLAIVGAILFLTGCYTPPPAYPPWEGPGPVSPPSWTNPPAVTP